MLNTARRFWRSARGLPVLRSLIDWADRFWWARVIRLARVVDLDFVEAQVGHRLTARAAVRAYVRGGFRSGLSLNPLFMEKLVSVQLPDSDRVPALYAYLVNDPRQIRVSSLWDSPSYAAEVPESMDAPGGPLGHRWRRAQAEDEIDFGSPGRATSMNWGPVHQAAVRAARERSAAVPSPTALSRGNRFVYVLEAGVDEDIAILADTVTALSRDEDIEILLLLPDAPSVEQRVTASLLELWLASVRRVGRDEVQLDALEQSLEPGTILVFRGADTEITIDDLRTVAARGAVSPTEPLWIAPDGTLAAAGMAVRNGVAERFLAGHPREDARACGETLPSAGLAGHTFALPAGRWRRLTWCTDTQCTAVAPVRDQQLRLRSTNPPVVEDLIEPLDWDVEDGDAVRFVRRPRSHVTDDGRVLPSLRWAIKTSAPAGPQAESWGDTHFARGIADALRRLGQDVVVDAYDARERPSSYLDQIVLAIRGPFSMAAQPGAFCLLWVISHPDEVSAAETDGFDRIFAASIRWASDASTRFGRTVTPLLQCTDAHRFHPSGSERGEDLVFVGTARGIARPSVVEPLRAGVPVKVYGPDWRGYIPASGIAAPGVPNAELPRLYEQAGAVLNDHWPAMRREGFVSNRLFDVVAAGGRAISDEVEGIDEIFEGAVITYRTTDDLIALVKAPLEPQFPGEDVLERISERVRRQHSFDARAEQLLESALAARQAE